MRNRTSNVQRNQSLPLYLLTNNVKNVEFVDEMPKTISGKIKRAELRDGNKTK